MQRLGPEAHMGDLACRCLHVHEMDVERQRPGGKDCPVQPHLGMSNSGCTHAELSAGCDQGLLKLQKACLQAERLPYLTCRERAGQAS